MTSPSQLQPNGLDMRQWLPDRDENEEYAPGIYCFTDETPQGRGGAAWVVLSRRKGSTEQWTWYCLKCRPKKGRSCEHADRINELPAKNNDAESDGA